MFVFDALPFAKNPLVIETPRADDFSPVKNADGLDSPQTCRDDQRRQFARWLNAHGAALATDATGLPAINVEVAPSFGYDEDSFSDSWARLLSRPELIDGSVLS
jgi:UDP-N-acetylglucosamine/UDP-N-acetylgalactosamine diphosphorylase